MRTDLVSNRDSALSSGSSGKLSGKWVPQKNRDTILSASSEPWHSAYSSGTNMCDLHSLGPASLWSIHGFISNAFPPRLCSICTGHLDTPWLFCLPFCVVVSFNLEGSAPSTPFFAAHYRPSYSSSQVPRHQPHHAGWAFILAFTTAYVDNSCVSICMCVLYTQSPQPGKTTWWHFFKRFI